MSRWIAGPVGCGRQRFLHDGRCFIHRCALAKIDHGQTAGLSAAAHLTDEFDHTPFPLSHAAGSPGYR